MSKSAIIIGGGFSQLEFIKYLKKKKYQTIVIDINPNAPAFHNADITINTSNLHCNKILTQLKEYKIDKNNLLLFNFCSGPAAKTFFKIQDYLTHSEKVSFDINNIVYKDKLRNFINKTIIDQPKYFIVNNVYDIPKLKLDGPYVVKPAYEKKGKSSIFLYNYPNDLDVILKSPLKNNKRILVEEFLDGRDIMSVGYVSKKKYKLITFLEEVNNFKSNQIHAIGLRFPKNLSEEIRLRIIKIVQNIIDKTNLNSCFFNVSFRVTNSYIKLIEIHTEIIGDKIFEVFIPKVYGLDKNKILLDIVVGKFNFLGYSHQSHVNIKF